MRSTAAGSGLRFDDEVGFDQAEPLARQVVRETAVFEEHAGFDVVLVGAEAEVGARHERARTIHDDALRVDHLAWERKTFAVVLRRWRRRGLRIETRGEEQTLDEITTCRADVGDAVRTTDGLQLFASELAEHERDATVELRAEQVRELTLRGGRASTEANAEEAGEIQDARLRQPRGSRPS